MKKLFSICFSLSIILLLTSCNNDISEIEATYTKASPIYADLDAIRMQPLNESIREVNNPGKVYVSEDILLIGEEKEGIHIFDNSNPSNPTPVSFISIPGNNEFYVHKNHIYAESYYDMLKIDISNMNSPQLINRIEEAFSKEFINEQGETLIGFTYEQVTETIEEDTDLWQIQNDNAIAYYNYANKLIPASAVPSSFAGSSDSKIGSVNRIAYSNGYLYTISNEQLTVFEDGAELSLVKSDYAGWQMETIYPYNKKLFVGTRASMEVFSTENPTDPLHETSFSHANACDPVLPDEDVAYVTLRTNGDDCQGAASDALLVINTSNIFNPELMEEIGMESPYGLALIGDKLYVGEGENGLKIFDASDKYNLELISHDKDVEAYDIIAHPTNVSLILVASPEGFGQYEISTDQQNLDLISWIASNN